MAVMVPSAAYSPSTGFHSVNTSGGSPAAISDSSLASPVALGMLDSVTSMLGWVALNSVTIWFSRVRVLPDHMVCQVMFATLLSVDAVLDEVDDVDEVDEVDEVDVDAAGPPQAARASTGTGREQRRGRRPASCPASGRDVIGHKSLRFLFLLLVGSHAFLPRLTPLGTALPGYGAVARRSRG